MMTYLYCIRCPNSRSTCTGGRTTRRRRARRERTPAAPRRARGAHLDGPNISRIPRHRHVRDRHEGPAEGQLVAADAQRLPRARAERDTHLHSHRGARARLRSRRGWSLRRSPRCGAARRAASPRPAVRAHAHAAAELGAASRHVAGGHGGAARKTNLLPSGGMALRTHARRGARRSRGACCRRRAAMDFGRGSRLFPGCRRPSRDLRASFSTHALSDRSVRAFCNRGVPAPKANAPPSCACTRAPPDHAETHRSPARCACRRTTPCVRWEDMHGNFCSIDVDAPAGCGFDLLSKAAGPVVSIGSAPARRDAPPPRADAALPNRPPPLAAPPCRS